MSSMYDSPLGEQGHLAVVLVVARDMEAGLRELHHQGQAHVTDADDHHAPFAALETFNQAHGSTHRL
jgi:hypothetical protein